MSIIIKPLKKLSLPLTIAVLLILFSYSKPMGITEDGPGYKCVPVDSSFQEIWYNHLYLNDCSNSCLPDGPSYCYYYFLVPDPD